MEIHTDINCLLHMMTSSNGNIFRVTGHLCGKFNGPRWIFRTKASDAELWCFFDLRLNKRLSKQPWGWWFETPSCPLWHHCNFKGFVAHFLIIAFTIYLKDKFGIEFHDMTPTLQWRDNGRDGVSNQQPHHCLLSRLFRFRSKKTPKLRVTGLCAGNPPMTSEFPAQRTSNAENVSIWWRHHENTAVHHWCILFRCRWTIDSFITTM